MSPEIDRHDLEVKDRGHPQVQMGAVLLDGQLAVLPK
jgi:hypothetical protein